MNPETNSEQDIIQVLGLDENSNKRKGFKLWLILAFIVVLAAVITLFMLNSIDKSNTVRYKTEKVVQGNLTVIVTATGTLQPMNKVEVGSELSGIIKSVEVDYNSRVKIGQVLARLDTSKLEAQITQAKAALESAKAKLLQAQATVSEARSKLAQLKKVQELSNNKVPSQAELDAAEATYERAKADEASARATVSQAQATLAAYETDLSKSVIRSPINGIVLSRSVEPGQTVAASFQTPVLFTLAEDLTQMELHVNVDEADIGKVKEGQRATFSVSAYPDRTFEAKITQVRFGSSTTSGVVTYETVLKVNNTDLSLRPGMTATADITVKNIENAILVPSAALRFTPPVQEEKKPSTGLVGSLLPRPPRLASEKGENISLKRKQQRVFILNDGKLVAVPVTVGSTDGNMTEIVGGDIKPGMAVVVDVIGAGK